MDLYDELKTSSLTFSELFGSLLEAARKSSVSVVDFLTLNASELALLIPRSINEIACFQDALRKKLQNQVFEVHPIVEVSQVIPPSVFTTGVDVMDEMLGGGIKTHEITEIFGKSSTGKSQLLMQLSLSVQCPVSEGGLDGKCVFITTEGDLPTKRIDEMIKQKYAEKGAHVSQNNIFTVACHDLSNQEHILTVQLPILLERDRTIKLVVIDSISHHVRAELESKTFKDSQGNRSYVDKTAQNLLQLATSHGIAVVVANQVADKLALDKTVLQSGVKQSIMDYDHQIGWIVGWKDSSIFYRHRLAGLEVKGSNTGHPTTESILSDDEDYNFVARRIMSSQLENRPRDHAMDPGKDELRTQSLDGGCTRQFGTLKTGKKRKLDTQVPNLGLTWANHVSTRILLTKTYKPSALLRKGELDLNKLTDSDSFWQARRTMKLVFAPASKQTQLEFYICDKGIEPVQDHID
ncbi:LAMI_0C07184g1_1 [Lachancea mirantina]|uniref:LAMI_0C07184g1_1 n=1 Tax=Lachancea mirantina TaxID=1230905 RepID=A0A1G4J426_9SACH|nr:LAMI_0C07184g1_1 [Lachancea mirantina]